MEAAATPRRPAGVAAVGVILYVVAFFNTLVGVALLVTDSVSDRGAPLSDYETVVAILIIVWGVLLLFVARGITAGSNFARVVWVVLMAFEVIAGVSTLVQGYIAVGFVSMLVPLFLMYLVFTPSAEAFFDS